MKLRRLTISGFAGISRTATIDLDADVVILLGSNGFGKSTICDAISWTLTGSHPRGADPRSWYGSGETFVELEVNTGGETNSSTIRRIVANPDEESAKKLETSVIVRDMNRQLRGTDAEHWISAWLQNAASDHEDDRGGSGVGMTDAFYLQQDSLREFLANRSDDQRFAALSQMVGARALSDLVTAFESASRAWTKSAAKEADEVRRRQTAVEAIRVELEIAREHLAEVRAVDSEAVGTWMTGVAGMLNPGPRAPQIAGDSSASALADALDVALSTRSALLSQLEARTHTLDQLEISLAKPIQDSVDETEMQRLEERMRGLELARQQSLESVEAAEVQLRAAQTRGEELRALAELALRHVSEVCPTCGQGVDSVALAERLTAVAHGFDFDHEAGEGLRLAQAYEARDGVQAAIQALSLEVEKARAVAERGQQERNQRLRWEAARAQTIAEIDGLTASLSDAGLLPHRQDREGVRDALVAWLDRAREFRADYLALEPVLALSSTEQRLRRLENEELRRQDEYTRASEALEQRQRTQALAESLLRAMKLDSENFLKERLRAIQPILNQLYAAIDPHPTLRGMELETRNWYGKNRLSPVLFDSIMDVRVEEPGRTLSTSQANALAVTLFLAFNLGLQPTRVESIIMDDPLQNLDDVHLLGLVDLLRRLVQYRQILITTHDPTFAALLVRKMRPLDAGGRLLLIRLEAWDREGPRMFQERCPIDPRPMKLVAG